MKEEMGHIEPTPGPWEIGDDGPILYDGMLRPVWNIYGGKGSDGRLVGSAEHFPDDEYPNANARLIAAAPDLLEVAQLVAQYGHLLPENVMADIRAALAKANP